MRGTGKYRGQRVDNGAWVYGDLIHFPATTAIGHPDKGGVYWEEYDVIPETVGEYTGIKDDYGRGQKIYENNKVSRGGDMIYIVIWRKLKGQWWLREYAGEELRGWSVPLMQAAEGYIEVIDIHEEKP